MTAPRLTHDVAGGAAWSVKVRAGRELRLTALDRGSNASTLLFAAHDPLDRLNVPDTLKAQGRSTIAPPMVLMSDRGTALASVTGSSLDWHDALCGHSTDTHVAAFGPSSYATDGNGWRRSARHGLLSELRKHGLGPADLHATVNFFAKAAIGDGPTAAFNLVADHSAGGDWVTFRAEQDLLVILSTAPHPLATTYRTAPVRVEVDDVRPSGAEDPGVGLRPEAVRALQATAAVFA